MSTAAKTTIPPPPAAPPVAPAPTPPPPNIPKAPPEGHENPDAVPPLDEFEGKFVRDSDGEQYALAIRENHILGRTHVAKNTVHTWEGTEEEFNKVFKKSSKANPGLTASR